MSDSDQGCPPQAGAADHHHAPTPSSPFQGGHHGLEPLPPAPRASGGQGAGGPGSRHVPLEPAAGATPAGAGGSGHGAQHRPLDLDLDGPAAPAPRSQDPAGSRPGAQGRPAPQHRPLDLDDEGPAAGPAREVADRPAHTSLEEPESAADEARPATGGDAGSGDGRPAPALPKGHTPLGRIDAQPTPRPEADLEPEAEGDVEQDHEDGLGELQDEAASVLEAALTDVPGSGDLYSDALEDVDELHGPPDALPGPDLSSGVNPRHMLESWLAQMVESRASDLILRAGGRPSCRVDGRITFLPGRVPGAGALTEVLEGIVGPSRMQEWRKTGSTDVALQLDGLGRFRLNAYRQIGEPALVLRRIAETPPKLEALCLPTGVLQKLAKRKRGIVLVTGVAGSGKSTTLAGLIQHMNETSERHIITLEDPVELLFKEDRCVISQREVGTDVPDFSSGLRHCLRQSPDVILIGEMRDAETVAAALDATETGHLVMSTLHTVNAAQTVDRIISFFPQEQHEQIRARLADNVAAVLSQRLLPRSSGSGMVPALELMTSTPRIMELLGEGRTVEISREIEAGEGGGLISFNQSLRQLVEAGLIELEVALSASDKPDELLLGLRGFNTAGARNQTATGSQPRPQLKLDDGRNGLDLG